MPPLKSWNPAAWPRPPINCGVQAPSQKPAFLSARDGHRVNTIFSIYRIEINENKYPIRPPMVGRHFEAHRILTAGLNWHPNNVMRLAFNYELIKNKLKSGSSTITLSGARLAITVRPCRRPPIAIRAQLAQLG